MRPTAVVPRRHVTFLFFPKTSRIKVSRDSRSGSGFGSFGGWVRRREGRRQALAEKSIAGPSFFPIFPPRPFFIRSSCGSCVRSCAWLAYLSIVGCEEAASERKSRTGLLDEHRSAEKPCRSSLGKFRRRKARLLARG